MKVLCFIIGHRWTYNAFWTLLFETTGQGGKPRQCWRCGRTEICG